MTPKRLLLRLTALLLGSLPPLITAAVPTEFHVSPRGKENASGSVDAPFSSLEAAREAVRKVSRADLPSGQPITIFLHGGDFFRTKAFELEAADSGTPEHPVIWRALPSSQPRLIGGKKLEGFAPQIDPNLRNRLPLAAREKVVAAQLTSEDRARLGSLGSRGFARPTLPAHSELFFRGSPLTLARWPNEGSWEKIAGFPASESKGDEHGGRIGELAGGFHYQGDRPKAWKNPTDLWVHGYWAWDWANSYEKVAKLDPDKRLVVTAAPYGNYGFRQGQRFCFINVLEELDEPGEWFLDRESGTVIMWPPASLEGGEVLLSLLGEPLVRLHNTHDVQVIGLTLEASRGNGIEIHGGTRNSIESCRLANLGNLGVVLEGGSSNRVVACDILETGDGGVSMAGGDRRTLTPGGHVVENCHFRHQGRWSKCYVPAILINGVGQRASHNLIEEHPHCAILFNGNEHLMEFNEIHHIALETGDVGAIYTGRDYTYRGNRILHNFIHHTGGVGMGSMGVYMDDCVSGTEIVGNVFYRVHWAIFLGGGRDHRVENNLLVDCDPALRIDGRGLDRSPVWYNMVYGYMKQQLDAVPSELYRTRYPAIRALDSLYAQTNGIPPEGNQVNHNVAVGPWLEASWHASLKHLQIGTNWQFKDRPFLSDRPMDFRLPENFAPYREGFQPIPVESIGLVTNAARRAIPGSTIRSATLRR